jgi:hypothetical protein
MVSAPPPVDTDGTSNGGNVVVDAAGVVVVVVVVALAICVGASVESPLVRVVAGVEPPDGAAVPLGAPGATVALGDAGATVVGDPPTAGAVVTGLTGDVTVVVVAAGAVVAGAMVVVVVVVAAGIAIATEAGDPDEMFAWTAEPVYETAKVDASARELDPDAPSAEIVETAEIVHTVDDVCTTVIDAMLVRLKSTPSTVESVPQSTWPEVAVRRN